MLVNMPMSVARYLSSLTKDHAEFAYIKLNQEGFACGLGGESEKLGVNSLKKSTPVDQQLDYCHGYLPISGAALVVPAVQIGSSQYVDLHMFKDSEWQWILLVDISVTANLERTRQQSRLLRDIKLAKKSS